MRLFEANREDVTEVVVARKGLEIERSAKKCTKYVHERIAPFALHEITRFIKMDIIVNRKLQHKKKHTTNQKNYTLETL